MPTPVGGQGVDLATLGIRVDATDVRQGTSALDEFTSAGERAERNARMLGLTKRQLAFVEREYGAAVAEAVRRQQAQADVTNRVAQATAAVAPATRRSLDGIGRLNNSMIVLTRSLTGVHPIIGQVTDAVGTFAIGTARMVPVLAGLSAIALALRAITREASEAKARLEEARGVLDKLRTGDPTQESVTEVQRRFDRDLERFNRLRRYTGTEPTLLSERDRLFQSLLEDAKRLAAGQSELLDKEIGDLVEQARVSSEALVRSLVPVEEAVAVEIIEFRKGLEREFQQERQRAVLETGRTVRSDYVNDSLAAKLQEEQTLLLTEHAERADEIARERERAIDAWVQGLYEVGRAYGGILDQLLSLTAATISLSQQDALPMATPKDRLRAYGVAALTGVGFGASTGSPILGGVAGGFAGNALTGNATGAILGSVGGIVSGLITHGQRAREAQRVWQRAFDAFGQMFDSQTSLEQYIRQIDDAFSQLTSGRSIDELRQWMAYYEGLSSRLQKLLQGQAARTQELIDAYEGNESAVLNLINAEMERYRDDLRVRLLRAQGQDDEAAALRLQIQHEEELRRAREAGYNAETLALLDQVQAQEKLAQARRDEADAIDSLFRALNAPAGLNLQYYGYRTGAPPNVSTGYQTDTSAKPDGGWTINGNLVVNVEASDSPEATAEAVIRTVERRALRGGPVGRLAVTTR